MRSWANPTIAPVPPRAGQQPPALSNTLSEIAIDGGRPARSAVGGLSSRSREMEPTMLRRMVSRPFSPWRSRTGRFLRRKQGIQPQSSWPPGTSVQWLISTAVKGPFRINCSSAISSPFRANFETLAKLVQLSGLPVRIK